MKIDWPTVINETVEIGVRIGVAAVVGGVAAAVTGPVLGISVAAGAIFCGIAVVINKIAEATLGKLFNLDGTNGLTHAIGRVVTVLVTVGVAAIAASLLGFSITLVGGLAILGVIALAQLAAYLAGKAIAKILSHIHIHINENRKQAVLVEIPA